MNRWDASIPARSVAAVSPSIERPSGDDETRILPTEAPNELSAARSNSFSPVRCLYFASRHTNLGMSLSVNDRGSKPSFRASENLSSVFAEAEVVASSLHHVGHAALSANSLNPSLRNVHLRLLASVGTITIFA